MGMKWWTDPDHAGSVLDALPKNRRAAVEQFLQDASPYLAWEPRVEEEDTGLPAVTEHREDAHQRPTRRLAWERVMLVLMILAPFVGYGLTWWALSTLGR